MSKRSFKSNESFSCSIPEYNDEFGTKKKKYKHKQHGFVSAFLYDKRMHKFIFESRGKNNTQYKSKVSPIGGKRDMYFCISKETMSRLEKRNETLLAIDGQEIKKSLMLPDGFGLNKEISLKIWKGDYDDKTINMIVKDENDLEMIYTQECIFVAMKREISEETGLDLDKIPCDLKYLGYDKKILATDGIITHVFLVIFDSYDFVPYSRETEKGNSLIGMSPNEIIKRIREDEKTEDINEKYFTPTIHNVFKEVNGYCEPIRHKMILFGGPNSGLSYGVKKCVEFFSEIGLEVSSTLTIPESYRARKGLKDGHLSIRNLFPTHFIKENNKVIH